MRNDEIQMTNVRGVSCQDVGCDLMVCTNEQYMGFVEEFKRRSGQMYRFGEN